MGFRDLDLPLSIKTTRANPIQTFFVPVLRIATHYDVAVGFFSSSWIRDAAKGIAQFACNGGQARWIVSPIMSRDDYQLICDASGEIDEAKVTELTVRSFRELYDALLKDTRKELGWLIRDRIMEFRVGIPRGVLSGMLHAKMGILRDEDDNQIGFSGSYNLTAGAETNWETIEIYCAWRSDEARDRIGEMTTDFTEMWEGHDSNLAIFPASERAVEPFIRETEWTSRPYTPEQPKSTIAVPERFLVEGELRQYQQDAINSWFKNNGRGILSMATGSGKTVTALAAAARLANYIIEQSGTLLMIVTVPYQHLANQWAAEAEEFGLKPVTCFGGTERWITKAQRSVTELNAKTTNVVVLVAVNDTFTAEPFQSVISGAHGNSLLIADEVHNLGATRSRTALPNQIRFRMGLSATPVRHGDEEGTEALMRYFGETVFEFSLKEAIEHGFLCKYYYHPVLAPLNDEEMALYGELSAKIAQVYASDDKNGEGPSEQLTRLLIQRARLIAGLESKVHLLTGLLKVRSDSYYNLVYCGDTRDADGRQVDKALRIVGHTLEMRASKFTAEENATERRAILEQFARGELQVLVAIRCLDEGVDVPRTETAYILASSTNPRQYIQRRGRILRRAPGKEFATIYDFIAVPDLASLRPEAVEMERRLVKRELERVNEFVDLAVNQGEALKELRHIKKRLHLLDS